MEVTLGFKAHSGWAALVVLGASADDFLVIDRKRIELVDELWAKAPYHAAETLELKAARELVRRGVEAAYRVALREVKAIVEVQRQKGNTVKASAVLVGSPMPEWSTDEILAVHFRMHKAEGKLFQDALSRASQACGLRVVAVPEKSLAVHAEKAMGIRATRLSEEMAAMGKTLGPPWGKDQKDSALAAWVALKGALKG